MTETNWRPWAAVAALGAVLYTGTGKPAAPPPARNWDVKAIWQSATAVPVPPVAVRPAPPPAPIVPTLPAVSAPAPSPPPVARSPVIIPRIVAPKPIVRETRREKPRATNRVERVASQQKPQQQRAPDNAETMPSCAQVCAYTRGKSYGQLLSEAANYNPSPRLRAHGIACYARCK